MPEKTRPRSTVDFPIINPDAAGCDVGASLIYVAVPPDRCEQEVRSFRTFTQDLQEAVRWLKGCRITTIAMESTSVYWIPFTQLLEDAHIQVYLVNAGFVKNVPAAFKSDNRDSRWIRNLHSVGLLSASFRPEQSICRIRSIARHRDNLTKQATRCVLHMQKALSQMNILLHAVISDITGVSGLAILDAILAGQRSPEHLVRLCDPRMKASDEDIKKALVGDWREEHLFTLRQSLASWRHFQAQIAECDAEISRLMGEYDDPDSPDPPEQPQATGRGKNRGKITNRDRDRVKRDQLTSLFGVDITKIPGVAVGCAEMFFTEVGRDLTRFHSADHFASWLGVSPNNRESGGRVLSRKTRKTKNRLATQLRISANTLTRSNSYLGGYLRKMKSRLGTPKGITATAHKLAVILYTIVTRKTPYDESVFERQEQRYRQKRIAYLQRQAADFGYDFVLHESVS